MATATITGMATATTTITATITTMITTVIDPGTVRHTLIGLRAAALLTVLFALRPAAAQTVNELCPVMTEEPVDPAITTVHQGKTVAFCCDRCLAKFEADPQRYLARLPQFRTDDGAGAAPADADGTGGGEAEDKVPWLGRAHPAVVHFPVAALPIAALSLLLWMASGRQSLARADVPPLVIGAAASVAAYFTGDIAHDAMSFSDRMHDIVERHEWLSTTVMVLAVVLLALRLWRWKRLEGRWRWIYAAGLIIASVLVLITGYLGGSLVFGPDHLKWS